MRMRRTPVVLREAAALLLAGVALAACGGGEPGGGGASGEAPANPLAGMAHGDHMPRYGGHVFMHGDLHFEVVLDPGGVHRIYFSDAVRNELPAAVAEDVRITVLRAAGGSGSGDGGGIPPEPLDPEIDDFGEAWIARGAPVETEGAVATVFFRFEDRPYEIEIPFIMAPIDPDVDPHAPPAPGPERADSPQ